MEINKAKKIGSKQALIFVGIGLLIAQLIMTWLSSDQGLMNGFFWFVGFSYNLNLLIGITIMFLSGHYFGQRAGVEILLKKRNYLGVGFKYAFVVLFTTIFLTSWVGYFQEGIYQTEVNGEPFNDYIFKPVFWVLLFGIVPVLIVGFLFGRQIKKQGDKI